MWNCDTCCRECLICACFTMGIYSNYWCCEFMAVTITVYSTESHNWMCWCCEGCAEAPVTKYCCVAVHRFDSICKWQHYDFVVILNTLNSIRWIYVAWAINKPTCFLYCAVKHFCHVQLFQVNCGSFKYTPLISHICSIRARGCCA